MVNNYNCLGKEHREGGNVWEVCNLQSRYCEGSLKFIFETNEVMTGNTNNQISKTK